jgi:tetratricopeptide (TPR) repeat protein
VLEKVDELGQSSPRWFARYFLASFHLVKGDLAESERVAEEAAQMGNDAGQTDALMIYGAQIAGIRLQQDRAEEIIELLEEGVEAYPGIPAWRAALALNYAQLGRLHEARTLVSEAAGTRLEGLPYDQARTTALAFYADAAFITDTPHAAEVLYDALEPCADEFVFNGAGSYGYARLHLGMLASLLDKPALADEHFEVACRLHDREGVRLWGAYGRLCWAESLARRGDTNRAREQARLARDAAQEHDYGLIERRAAQVLEPLPAK